MKKITSVRLLSLLALSLLSPALCAQGNSAQNYLQYFPENSLIRKKIETCKKARFCKNSYEKSCEYILSFLKGHDEEMQPASRGFGGSIGSTLEMLTSIGNQNAMKDAVRTLLKKQSDEVKWQEYEYIKSACYKIVEARKVRLEQEKKEVEEKAKNQTPKF